MTYTYILVLADSIPQNGPLYTINYMYNSNYNLFGLSLLFVIIFLQKINKNKVKMDAVWFTQLQNKDVYTLRKPVYTS